MSICKNCIHFSDMEKGVGICNFLDNDFDYWDDIDNAVNEMEDGKILCTNLYVSQNFGCIHFTKKETPEYTKLA